MDPTDAGAQAAGLAWPLVALVVLGAAGAGWFAREAVRRFRRAKPAGDQGVPRQDAPGRALGATPIGIGFADRGPLCPGERSVRPVQRVDPGGPCRPAGPRAAPPPGAWELGEPLLRRVLETGEPASGVHIRLGEPGGREAVRVSSDIFPVRRPPGCALWGVGATVLDVTARRTEEERERLLAALRESEARFRALSGNPGDRGAGGPHPQRIWKPMMRFSS